MILQMNMGSFYFDMLKFPGHDCTWPVSMSTFRSDDPSSNHTAVDIFQFLNSKNPRYTTSSSDLGLFVKVAMYLCEHIETWFS